MKQMKKSIDKKTIFRKIMQSLPAASAAIAFVIYGTTFLPFSADRMKSSVALRESVSYYEILSGGKPLVYCRCLGDSCLPEGLSPTAGQEVMTKSYATACWVNRYPLFPSCPGLLMTAVNDSAEVKAETLANRDIRQTIKRTADRLAERLKNLENSADETNYYLSVHNVNDDGYNVMAEYSEQIKEKISTAAAMLTTLRSIQDKSQTEIRRVSRHTLLYINASGDTVRTACRMLTPDHGQPLRLMQTADKEKPDGASAIYLHTWLSPVPDAGDTVFVASITGCSLHGNTAPAVTPKVFAGTATGCCGHDLPPLLAPDGSPVFSRWGIPAGISFGGIIINPAETGFALKRLLP